MTLQLTLNFDSTKLKQLLMAALSAWGGSKLDNVTINADSTGLASGYGFIRERGKTLMVNFSHEVIARGIAEASAAKGNPIVPGSLAFEYHPGSGYGGGSFVTATALLGKPEDALPAPAPAQSGKVIFPGTVTVAFGIDELKDLLESAARRAGYRPGSVVLSYTDEKTASATISVTINSTNGSLNLSPAELNQALTEELTAQGFTVAPDGFRYSYAEATYGSRAGTSVTVTLTSLPIR